MLDPFGLCVWPEREGEEWECAAGSEEGVEEEAAAPAPGEEPREGDETEEVAAGEEPTGKLKTGPIMKKGG